MKTKNCPLSELEQKLNIKKQNFIYSNSPYYDLLSILALEEEILNREKDLILPPAI